MAYQQRTKQLRDKFVAIEEEHFGANGNFSDVNYEDYLIGEVVKIKDEECQEKIANIGGKKIV